VDSGIGPEGLCPSVELGRGLLRDRPRLERPRVSLVMCVLVTLLTNFRFVEFETAADLRTAVEKLDGREFKGQRVQCVADV
jgi:RNA recognition motif-containing protein